MTEPVRVHMRVPGTAPLPELMGLSRASRPPASTAPGSSTARCGAIPSSSSARPRAHTKRLQLFPAVTNPFTRHASVLAGAIQTVEEIAPGRMKCVIGTGYSSASTIGRKPATLAEMRECIATVKTLLAGRKVDFGGTRGGWAMRRAATFRC